jgi:hypothetical protein
MLKGFTAPRSPMGAAALVPSPPWHFAGDVLAVAAGYPDRSGANEQAMSMTDNLTVAGAWIGKGELNFAETDGEEPNRIESGFATHFHTRLAI